WLKSSQSSWLDTKPSSSRWRRALTADTDNEDLLKLQKDLTEVIELTKDLLASQPSETPENSDGHASAGGSQVWKVGDRCMSVWTEDGQWYEAEIEEIDEENGTGAITFLGYGNAEVTSLLNLKPVEEGRKTKEVSGSLPMSKKELIAQQREYKKKKALKKAQRIKELEQEREDQKVKWQQFNNKAYSKNKKGQVKRSIFCLSGERHRQGGSRHLWHRGQTNDTVSRHFQIQRQAPDAPVTLTCTTFTFFIPLFF
ncbi:unnamed protein product, partial [Staurois parvus]